MMLPDVNVLVYAFRRDSDRHAEYRAWLQAVVDDPNVDGVSLKVLAGVLRICTHRKIDPSAFDADRDPGILRGAPRTGALDADSSRRPSLVHLYGPVRVRRRVRQPGPGRLVRGTRDRTRLPVDLHRRRLQPVSRPSLAAAVRIAARLCVRQ